MGRSSVKDPPVFSKSKDYSQWKNRLKAWKNIVTENDYVKKGTIGQVLALSLPDTPEEDDIQGKLHDALGNKIEGEEGYDEIVKWLDKHMGRDEVGAIIDNIRQFMRYRRTDGQSLKEYIAGFDAKYQSARRNAELGALPEPYLMYMLMENAGVSEQDSKMIISGVNIKEKTTLYDQTKTSMIKFLVGVGGDSPSEGNPTHRIGDTFFTRNPAWQPVTPYTPRFPIQGGGEGSNRGGYGFGRGGRGGFSNERGGFNQRGLPRKQVRIPMNPMKNGKRTLCEICGSWTHYRRECQFNQKPTFLGEIQDAKSQDDAYYQDEDCAYLAFTRTVPEEQEETLGAAALPQGPQDNVHEVQVNQVEVQGTDHVAYLVSQLQPNLGPEREFKVMNVSIMSALLDKKVHHPGAVVFDTGCVETVASVDWINTFLEYLHPATKKLVKVESSQKVFRFGGGERRKSIGTFYIPCSLEGVNTILIVDGVHQKNLPCLLSKKAMKNADTHIHMKRDEIEILGTTAKLRENDSGHYVMWFEDVIYGGGETSVMWTGTETKSDAQIHDELRRVHRGLGHPGRVTMDRMIKETGTYNEKVKASLDKIYEACETCHMHAKSKNIPKVAAPTATDVGHTISVDLKFFKIAKEKTRIILYIIDEYSRYVVGVEVPNREGETIVKAILQHWIQGTPYGAPYQIKSDNGGEFINRQFKSMCELYGIRHLTTGAYSPWSNGGNERNHATVDLILKRMLHDNPNISFKEALQNATYAKNTLLNVHGFSPCQILTGRQPRLPGACNEGNLPPADSERVDSKHVQQSINNMMQARQAWSRVDNSTRLRRAMKVQPTPLQSFDHGDIVFYKHGIDDQWHGEGKVIGQDGKKVYLHQGGRVISTSPPRLHKPPVPMEQMVHPRQEVTPTVPQQAAHGLGTPPGPVTKQRVTDTDSSSSSDEDRNNGSSTDSSYDEDSSGDEAPGRRGDTATAGLDMSGSNGYTPTRQSPDFSLSGDLNLTTPGESAAATESPTRERTQREGFTFRKDQLERMRKEGPGLTAFRSAEQSIGRKQPLPRGEGGRSDGGQQQAETEKRKVKKKKDMKAPERGAMILYRYLDQDIWYRAQVLGRGNKTTSRNSPYINVKIMGKEEETSGFFMHEVELLMESEENLRGKNIYQGKEASKERKKKSPKAKSTPRKRRSDISLIVHEGGSPQLRRVRTSFDDTDDDQFMSYYTYTNHQIPLAQISEMTDTSYVVFVPKEHHHKEFVIEAKQKEIQNFKNYDAFEEVSQCGQRFMTSSWIITEKQYGEKTGAKARLVVHGNQEKKLPSYEEYSKDSPTVTKLSLRIQFFLAAQFGWELVMADVTSAFLQSEELEREVFVKPPPDVAPPGILWRLKKPMYGLDDASFRWYVTVRNRLLDLGCKQLLGDPATFYWLNEKGQLAGIISTHVDDILACGSDEFYEKVLNPLMSTFNFGSTAEGKYRCLGWNVEHRDDCILVSQKDYITTKIDYCDVDTRRHSGLQKVTEEEATKVRGSIGRLRWLADQCRPDIAFSQLEISIDAHAPTYETVKQIQKMVKQVKTRHYDIKYSKLRSRKWFISVFSDSSLHNLKGSKGPKTDSAMGYSIFMSEGYRTTERNRCNLLAWRSCKTTRITVSTHDAEAIALGLALEKAIFIKHQIVTMLGTGEEDIIIEAFCDNNDVVENIKSHRAMPSSKGDLGAIDIARMKEMIQKNQVQSVKWVPTKEQIADVFTKKGAPTEPYINIVERGQFNY